MVLQMLLASLREPAFFRDFHWLAMTDVGAIRFVPELFQPGAYFSTREFDIYTQCKKKVQTELTEIYNMKLSLMLGQAWNWNYSL
jgi:hypothetical protein